MPGCGQDSNFGTFRNLSFISSSSMGGSWKVAKPIAIAQLKMEDACILCSVIEIFWQRKVTKIGRGGPFSPLKLQMTLT